jgi:hypothetical protein
MGRGINKLRDQRDRERNGGSEVESESGVEIQTETSGTVLDNFSIDIRGTDSMPSSSSSSSSSVSFTKTKKKRKPRSKMRMRRKSK